MFFEMTDKLVPCGIYSWEHFLLLGLTLTCVFFAVKFSAGKNAKEVRTTIKRVIVFLWFLEIVKIVLTVQSYGWYEVNKYIPLYFCSLILYAGLLSGFAKGKMRRIGDVFLSTGAIVAGLIFLLYPLTSLPNYPLFHFISLHSFVLHGLMLYLGLLIHATKYIELKKEDIKYYASLILTISAVAYVFNHYTGGNLMFISQNFPGTFIEPIYNCTGLFFPIVMITVQAVLPFYVVYTIVQIYKNKVPKP